MCTMPKGLMPNMIGPPLMTLQLHCYDPGKRRLSSSDSMLVQFP